MVASKKTAPPIPNGNNSNGTPNRKDSPSLPHYQKRDMAGKADGKSQNGNFRTDTAISGNRAGGERVLQRWQPDAPPSNADHSLEKSTGGWNQFETNERLFGLKTDYDENMYTTRIDKSHPRFKERMAIADRKAKEIEGSAASTSHVAEERVMDFVGGDNGGDEEDKYSGVKRQQQNDFPPLPGGRENKYTPPARRAPTGSATVKGAPFDPAIISSQLKSNKPQNASKQAETAAPAASSSKSAEPKTEATAESSQKAADVKAAPQAAAPLKPSSATSRTISPQGKDAGPTPNATSTVERDVLVSFKAFANQQRTTAEKQRVTKARADKEIKLTELKKFAASFKLPTPVPQDLIGIIAKDPAKQQAIQQKAARDVEECERQKVENKAVSQQQKKQTPTPKDGQATTSFQGNQPRTSGAPQSTSAAATVRHPMNNRASFVPQPYPPFRNGNQQMGPPGGRQSQGLAARIQNQKMGEVRQPPTGPANVDPSFGRRGPMPAHMNKLNPNSHEFRPSPFAAAFNPNGHPSAGSSPKSALNNAVSPNAASTQVVDASFNFRKKTIPKPEKCNILANVKSQKKPEGKNWADNDGYKPPFDTAPAWRLAKEDGSEKSDSTMLLSYTQYFERQPFTTKPTPNTTHSMPHQYQLPLHLQQGAHNVGPRVSPHVPPVTMHPGQHGPMAHGPFNGADDHRMMHSNSSQSYSSARAAQIPAQYPPNMNTPGQMPYVQNGGMPFMVGNPQQMGYNPRSFSNNPGYMPPQGVPMGNPAMPQFMAPQGMPAGQMQMYGGPPFMPPGAVAPQPMPGANGYPSPGRPAASMMVPQGSQSGQPMYGMSPGMQYGQPVFPQQQQQGQVNNMRGYSNPGYQQYGSSPQMHNNYSQQHRNGNNNYNKNFQGNNHHQPPQTGHSGPSAPHGRTPEGTDEAK